MRAVDAAALSSFELATCSGSIGGSRQAATWSDYCALHLAEYGQVLDDQGEVWWAGVEGVRAQGLR